MKKTLIALAVLAASGAAMAQSSVTLYGVADISVGKTTGEKFRAYAGGGGSTDIMNNGNSRIGFKGVEDLGGGLKVSFNYEGGLNIANGKTDSNTYARAAFVALSGGFGELYAGRRLSPAFFGMANYELTGTANYSALANTFGFGGSAAPRNDAFIGYTTPNLSGFKATVGTRLAGNNAPNGAKTDMNVTYNNGPLAAGFSYEKTSGFEKGMALGASYDLGQFIVAASYQDPEGVKKGFTIGGTAKLGANSVTLDIARDTGSAVKYTNYVLEAKEPLSKRTFLYQVYYRDGLNKKNSIAAGLRHNF